MSTIFFEAKTDAVDDSYVYKTTGTEQKKAFVAQGTWDTATVTLQFSIDGGTTWHDYGASTTLTANGYGIVSILQSSQTKVVLSGPGAGTSLSAYFVDVNE